MPSRRKPRERQQPHVQIVYSSKLETPYVPTYVSTEQISQLHERVALQPAYFGKNRNITATLERYKDVRAFQTHKGDYARLLCMLDFVEWTQSRRIGSPDSVLVLYMPELELQFLRPRRIFHLLYKDGSGDLHYPIQLPHAVDFVLLGQTLEHVYNPFVCLKNVYDALRPGGHVFISVPYYNMLHMTPFHFYHYSPSGLATLLESSGFTVLEMGQFGNKDYVNHILTKTVGTGAWPSVDDLRQDDGTIENEPGSVSQVWALAVKSASA